MIRFIRTHPFLSIEGVLAIYVLWLLTDPVFRAALATNLTLLVINLLSSMRSTLTLLQVDTRGTVESLAQTGGKLFIATFPILVLARRWRGWKRLQLLPLAFLYLLLPLAGTVSLSALVAVSGLALWLSRYRWLRWTAATPLAMMCASVPIHQYGFVWDHAALVEHCQSNSGRRPVNLQPDQIAPRHVGASVLRPDEVLLPGADGISWWLRRTGDDWKIEAPSKVNFPFWPGCVMGDELWLARPNFAMSVRRDPNTGVESVRKISIPVMAMDFGWIVCIPEKNRVLVTEALSGSGIWEIDPEHGTARRLEHEVGGLGVLARRGKPGQLIAANGSDLIIYSIENEDIIERTAAGVQMFNGLDVCPLDLETALADVTGRVRIFKPDARGHYRFDWGISLQAPRSLAYSPDCQYLAVASWDDETVWLIDLALRRTIETYRVGPALRAITFLGPREFAVVDACTMTTIRF